MAFGIAGVAALPGLPGVGPATLQVYAAGVVLLWLLAMGRFAVAARSGALRLALQPPLGRFGLGTWGAGTAAVGLLVLQVWPQARPAGLGLLFIAAAFWVALVIEAVLAAPRLLRQQEHRGPGGTTLVLLLTVATQAVLLLGCALDALPVPLRSALLAAGVASYVAGMAFALQAHKRHHDWELARHAAATNCIVHGALAITGLASIRSGLGHPELDRGLWVLAACAFVVIEVGELLRLRRRIAHLGWTGALLHYRVSQWVRNFTFGMLLAYTLALQQQGVQPGLLAGLLAVVAAVGPWLVMALLVIESALWLFMRLQPTHAPEKNGMRADEGLHGPR